MTSHEQLQKTFELIKLERQADLDYYRQKVLLRSIHERTKEGTTWYPLRFNRDYIGTGERLIIEVERTNNLEQPHAFQSGKSVSVFSNASGKPEKEHVNGVVNYVRDNIMSITLNSDDLPDWLEDGLLGVDVMFDEMSYREMEFALKEVMKAEDNRVAVLREILLGEEASLRLKAESEKHNVEKEKSKDENIAEVPAVASLLNVSQQDALTKVLETADVAFIHGPPGTGKTTTIVQAIIATVKAEKQVLVCAPSNAAVDLLADKLSEQGMNVLRIGHPARVTEQSLSKTMDARIASHSNYPELREIRKRMEQLRGQAHKFKRNFGFHEREQRKLLKQEVKILKGDADMLEFYIINDLLQNSDVICSTLVGSSHPTLRGKRFKTVFIDEAGQALEPACWIPILRSERIIFAGDHLQLPPTIKSNEAARLGLSKTLFEKGIEKHPNQSSMLQVQYRMHEDIMKFSSKYFYNDELVAHDSVKKELLRPNQPPVEYIDTAGAGYIEGQDKETLSRFNHEEAQMLIRQVEKLVEEIGVEEWLQQRITMAIITPYRAQVDYILKLAEASPVIEPLHGLISINTVDAFQGQERDVIAISFVRSNDKGEVGFLNDIRRTNVAMTRAKKKLIMIGDSATLGAHPFYLELIDYVQQKEFYKSVFELMSGD
ncbi:AAA domain-containing protein [Ohtaekwangia koreensis]|uniref:DNA helicase, putative n=1 Tax=Ohtaekwangia koreensis TaxID=688867 RepID=A0A1T5MNN8_9BACT|nr:AAA domain-containing protein [Ohtaekwangia koreensis]SKC89826.1 DNA helicase, putative [Ohtaekwangia koreensis]